MLDEPTVGLDPVLRAEPWSVFRALADDGATLIVSSHVMDEALRCDRLLLMRAGRIIADTTPAGLLAETGTMDPDAAFLALIERDSVHQPGAAERDAAPQHPGTRHPSTRRDFRDQPPARSIRADSADVTDRDGPNRPSSPDSRGASRP